jgi:hypothetical protein
MNFRFLHAADIHLDSPLRGIAFSGLGRADAFRSASRRAFENLVVTAIERQVAFLLLAGDIFDGDWRDFGTGLFFTEQMGKLDRAGIQVFITDGNHDAATVIRKRLIWPENVTVFPSRQPHTFAIDSLRVALHGQSFGRPDVSENLALSYPPNKAGCFNIGLLHTACNGREGHALYAPCSLPQLVAHGYDYWALGHVHGREILNEFPHVVFPGNLQGRHVRETGAKGATLVHIADGHVINVEHLVLDVARWALVAPDVSLVDSMTDLMELVRTLLGEQITAADGRPVAVRVAFSGTTKLHAALASDPMGLRAGIEAAALAVSDEFVLEKIKVATSAPGTNARALRADVLSELWQSIMEVGTEATLCQQLTRELRGLRKRLPCSDIDDLPSDNGVAEIVEAAQALLMSRLAQEG